MCGRGLCHVITAHQDVAKKVWDGALQRCSIGGNSASSLASYAKAVKEMTSFIGIIGVLYWTNSRYRFSILLSHAVLVSAPIIMTRPGS
jgi:hypothetical protein